jgi:hypothetical protein
MTEQQKCYDCASWCGRCRKGHRNRIASSEACTDDFKQKDSFLSVIAECFDTVLEVCAPGYSARNGQLLTDFPKAKP